VADLSDVERALVAQAARSLGITAPYSAGSLVASPAAGGAQCRVFRGWPVANQLDDDLAAGIVNVSIFPLPNMVRLTTRYFPQWEPLAVTDATLTFTISGRDVTFAGTANTGQVAGILVQNSFESVAYPYRLASGDTPATVALALGTAIPGATVSGSTVTMPGNHGFVVRVAVDRQEWMETRRQSVGIWIICWCPTPKLRDLVASTIDAGIANMTDDWGRLTSFLSLADGSAGCVSFSGTHTNDAPQQANLWRRDLRYIVEYATSLVELHPTVMFPEMVLQPNTAASVTIIS
jgi:hypothetical protein